jgi:cytochrome c oxidase assembly protein subunit 15
MTSAPAALSDSTASLRRWLLACIVAVFLAVSVGGITRLTESGLSITEWKPVSGVLPPTSAEVWQQEFEKFLQIPQASATHAGITLSEFKWIYWWEWFHRIVARTVGLVFAIPFLWYLAKGMIPPRYRLRLAWLPLLTLGQGVLGWYMVQSGLSERTEVSAYRLAAHLSLALAILVIAVWTREDLRAREPAPPASAGWRRAVNGLALLIGITIVSGAFVAGLRAGKMFNTFPLMGGQVVPGGYGAVDGLVRNAAENPIAAQFHHRVLAIVTALLALVMAWRAGASELPPEGRQALRALGAVLLLQVAAGIATLLLAVPVWLGALHQFIGVLTLTAAVLAVHRMRGAEVPSGGHAAS